MRDLWWQLPGPKQFVARIVQDLQDGKNVVFCLPEHFPKGLNSAVRSTFDNHDCSWHTIRLNEEEYVRPIDLLFSYFIPNPEPSVIRSPHTLSKENSFSGRI